MPETLRGNYLSPWGPGLKPPNEILLSRFGREEIYAPGSHIFRQGDAPSGRLYYLREGMVRITVLSESGAEKTIYIMENGSFLGEATFFEGDKHFASAEVVRESSVIILDKKGLRALLKEDVDFAFFLMQVLSRKLRKLSSQIEDLTFLSLQGRLSRLLLKLAEDFGVESDDGLFVPLDITDEQLGKLTGVRREAATKALSKLREQNLIFKQNRKIYINSLENLRRYVKSCF